MASKQSVQGEYVRRYAMAPGEVDNSGSPIQGGRTLAQMNPAKRTAVLMLVADDG